jgi:hypothetical protein
VTVYAELLKLALADDQRPDSSLARLVDDVAARRRSLEVSADPAARLTAALAYDCALARLCATVGIGHDLTGDDAGSVARERVERALAAAVPTLVGSPPEESGSGRNGGGFAL